MYDGTRLCNRQRGAVVVAINYRLGALGFLLATGGAVTPLPSRLFGTWRIANEIYTEGGWLNPEDVAHRPPGPRPCSFLYKPGGDIPANLGLLDMLAALRWVQKEVGARAAP